MKILHTSADWKWTGPAEPVLHAVTGLRARGCQADLACPGAPPGQSTGLQERARERGVEPVHRLVARRGYLPLRDRAEVGRLREVLRLGRYDLVHAHHTRDHLLSLLAARPLGLPVVASWHRGEPIPGRLWNRLLLGPGRNAGLVTLSERVASKARASLGWPVERVGVVPGAVDSERYCPRPPAESIRAELGLRPGERVLGVVARLQRHRRFDLLLEAFARARGGAAGLRLVVVGRGTRARQVLEEPVRRLGLDGAVVRAGYRRDDLPELLSLFDALVFLVPGSDGSYRAVLEAMASGIPTIASRRGVLPETLVDGETGRLVDENPAQLAEAFLDVWRHPELWRRRGEAARRRALAEHSLARQSERLLRFYKALLGSAS